MDVFERRVLDTLPVAVWTVDLAGRITGTNRAWDRLAQPNSAPRLSEAAPALGAYLWQAISDPDSREQLLRAMVTLRAGQAPAVTWEFASHARDEERIFLMQATPLLDDDAVTGFVLAATDITTSHRSRDRRRLEAIGEIVAGVAQELRNPLFGISSAAQLLRFRAREDPIVEKNVGRVLREVERLNRMVTSLLEYGRPRPAKLVRGDPERVWDDVLEGNRGRLESRSLRLCRTRAEQPAECLIDAEQLAQAFANLLANAVDAAPQATDLTLTSGILSSGAWRCRLHDGGPAIPPEVLPRVFELFYSTKAGGTGIGLALCQRIIEEHRGTLAIESAPESGTTVTVVLPGA